MLCVTLVSKSHVCQAWFCTPLIPALQKQRQAHVCEFWAYVMSSRTARAMWRPCLKRKKKKKKWHGLAFVKPVDKWPMWALVPVSGEGRKVLLVLSQALKVIRVYIKVKIEVARVSIQSLVFCDFASPLRGEKYPSFTVFSLPAGRAVVCAHGLQVPDGRFAWIGLMSAQRNGKFTFIFIVS